MHTSPLLSAHSHLGKTEIHTQPEVKRSAQTTGPTHIQSAG
ncbi:hypothetical protein ACFPK9_07230 [Rubritalea spongiae]|uniref:Uncharacterized protein n=1 Tax=Rubritalea spongiae TaxID=430797 RepID=A0ABW5E1W0_9BACT